MQLPNHRIIVAIILVAALGASAQAATFTELAALSDRSQDERSGLELAQEQASRGEFLEAIATLERTQAANPKSSAARLLHAYYLCKTDDRLGGSVEIEKLKKKDYSKEDLATARTQCGMDSEG